MLKNTKTAETLRLIRCDIVDETYGLDMTWVRSIQRADRLRRNPEAKSPSAEGKVSPDDLRDPVGWLPSDEGEIPVFNMASQLGRPSKALPPTGGLGRRGQLQRVIVLNPLEFLPRGKRGELWGLLVDRVSQVIQVPAERVVPLPSVVVNPSEDYFTGVIRMGEELVLFLSPEHLHPDAPRVPESFGKLKTDPVKGLEEWLLDVSEADKSTEGPAHTFEPMTNKVGDQSGGYGQIVIFSITEPRSTERPLSFGLSISQVPEILEPLPTIPVPAAPASVLGLINWRDRPVPLIDLADRLGLKSRPSLTANGAARLIIVRDKVNGVPVAELEEGEDEGTSSRKGFGQGALIGFLIQQEIRVLRLPIKHQVSRRTPLLDLTMIRGIVELENETLVIPDIGGILRRSV